MSRDLSALALCAVMIDGIHMGEQIEFLNSRIRKTTHNVTRWEGGERLGRDTPVARDVQPPSGGSHHRS